MGVLTAAVSLALATHAVSIDGYPLRAGCDASDKILAHLHEGDPVEIRFALAGGAGACYKVSVISGDQQLQGYVSAEAIANLDQFEQARRSAVAGAAPAGMPTILKAEVAQLRKEGATGGQSDLAAQAATLLDDNRPNEALKVLEDYLRRNRRDADVLSLAGYAAYQSDRMQTAIDYWRESLAMHPSPAVERLLSVAEREASEDLSGEKLFGTQFLLRYNRDQMSADLAGQVVAMLDREYLRISQELGCPSGERIVAIVQTPEEYRRTTDAAEWSGGQYNGRMRVAVMDQSQLGENTRRAFSHEIVHACLHQLGDFPQWLHEGLAQKLSGETLSSAELAAMKRLGAAGQLPRLDHLSQTWSRMSPTHASVAYTTALAAVELLYQHHAGLGPRNLLRNPHLLPQITADLDRRLRQ